MIELMKVPLEERLIILAISNGTAEHFAADRGMNCAVDTHDSGALPAQIFEVKSTPATSSFDRIGIIKLAAERLVSLEETAANTKAA